MTSHHKLTLRFLAEPTDINYGGKVHGGAVMKWIDQGAFACASSWCKRYCVTVYVGGIRFIRPILIGNMVEVRSRLILTGTTSMHIAVDVFASDPKTGIQQQTTHCIIVFVALDEKGKPTDVPQWQPVTEDDRQLEEYARVLMEKRKEIEEEMRPFFDKKRGS